MAAFSAGRVRLLNDKPLNAAGRFVLYWVQASPRASLNHALEVAVEKANAAQKPLLAAFVLTKGREFDRNANLRHYAFLVEGLGDLHHRLGERGVRLCVALSGGEGMVGRLCRLAEDAVEVVVDQGYLRVQRLWYDQAAHKLKTRLTQEDQCAQFRPKHRKHCEAFLQRPFAPVALQHPSLVTRLGDEASVVDVSSQAAVEAVIASLDVDHTVNRVPDFRGGESEAQRWLELFCREKLPRYEEMRNHVGKDFASHMSPYLHFGHISPLECVLTARRLGAEVGAPKACVDKFVEQTMNRREFSMNVLTYLPDGYDKLESMAPDWALKGFAAHANDPRPHLYSREELEAAQTQDAFWNAAQLELVETGKMQGYMRMYWCKQIMDWSPDMHTAYETSVYLNDKYSLDGRDPNSYLAIAWCFGHSDRAGQERPRFGRVSVMTSQAIRRKYGHDAEEYIKRCFERAGRALGKGPTGQSSRPTGEGPRAPAHPRVTAPHSSQPPPARKKKPKMGASKDWTQ